MNGMLLAAGFGAGLAGGITDWLFMGALFHDAYNRYPDVWWPGIRGGKERGPVIWSSLLGFVMSGAIVALCALVGVHGIAAGLAVAGLVWLAGPFVVVVVNGFFVKIDPRITFAHCVGWLARMLIAGAGAGFVLHA